MSVAVAVTTYNRLASLERCIDAIRAQDRPPDEIIVVDDVSTDGSAQWLDAQPDVVAIHQPTNGGCANSFHTVLEAAYERGHDFAWAMDDDVFPEPAALSTILHTYDDLARKGVKVGALTACQSQWDDGGEIWLPFRLPTSLGRAFRYRYLSPELAIERGKGEPQEIDLYTFVGTLFPRGAMAEVGFPRPDFYYYGEDTDYALRLAAAGYKAFIVPRSVVEHTGGGFRAPALLPPKANWRYYYMYRNQLTLVRMYRERIGTAKALACALRIMMGVGKRLYMEARRANFGACRMALLGVADALVGRMGKRVGPDATASTGGDATVQPLGRSRPANPPG